MSSPRPLFREIMDFKDFVFSRKNAPYTILNRKVELTAQKIVCPSTFELERTALRIFTKLGTKLDIDKIRKITEPDF